MHPALKITHTHTHAHAHTRFQNHNALIHTAYLYGVSTVHQTPCMETHMSVVYDLLERSGKDEYESNNHPNRGIITDNQLPEIYTLF